MASQRHSLHGFQNTSEINIGNFCVDTFIFYKMASFYSDECHDECISTLNITNACMMMWTAVSVTGLLIAIIIIIIIRKTVAINDISKLLTV